MNIKEQLGKLSFAITLSCFVLICTACTNLAAVHEWSKTSLEATQFNEIVTTFVDTPERLKRYDSNGPWQEESGNRKKQSEALKQMLSIVSDYMNALATLSADATVDYKKDVDVLTASIGKLDAGVSKDTLGAAGSLASTVLNAAAKAYQAAQVEKIVEEANAPLQLMLRSELRNIVDKDFRRDLQIEKSSMNAYYDYLLRHGNPSEAAKDAVNEWQEERIRQNDKKLRAVDAYLKVIDTVAIGHQKLFDNRNKLDAKALIKDLYSLSAELRKQIKILAT